MKDKVHDKFVISGNTFILVCEYFERSSLCGEDCKKFVRSP